MEWKRALTVGRAVVLVPTSYSTSILSPYCPSDSPLPQSVHFISLLFYYSLKIGGDLGGANDGKEAFEGDQELYELLFICKRPLLAMRSAGGRGIGQELPCPVEVKIREGRECGG